MRLDFRQIRSLTIAWLLLALLAPAWACAEETPDKPRSLDARVALIVTELIDHDHMSKHALDDEISERAIEQFIDGLDEMKRFFIQSDIDEFMKNRRKVDDLLKAREIQFPYTVYTRFLKRIRERVKLVDELLEGDFDFAIDETVPIDPEAAKYAANDEEVRDMWRRRIKYELLMLKAEKTKDEEARDTIRKRYRNLERTVRQWSHDDVMERFLSSVASSYDPHTSYFSPSTLEDFRIRMGLNYQGIGAELSPSDSGSAIIRRVMEGGGADEGGQLKAKDRIVSVGQGEEGEMVDVRDKRLDDIIKLIRGPEGTVVRLGVIPDGEEDMRIYNITRRKIILKDNSASGKVYDVAADGPKIGVIDLQSFYLDMEARRRGDEDFRSTTRDVRKILEDFKRQQVDAVVLDLRYNGGGSLDEAIDLTGLFIDNGPVVQVKDSLGRVKKHEDTPGTVWDGPLVVLTSKYSASASEIVAGAVQDYRRGLIVGDETTHGKGTVQSLVDLGRQLLRINMNLGALKLTMQQFYRPGGASTQNEGVKSDVVLPSISNVVAKGEKELDYALAFDRVPAAAFQIEKLVTDDILAPIREKSLSRWQKSTDFQKVLADIEKFKKQKDRLVMPLNEKKFMEIRAEFEDSEDIANTAEPDANDDTDDAEEEQPDYYLSEVLQIASDYIEVLGGGRG